jgi:hypothetical protein
MRVNRWIASVTGALALTLCGWPIAASASSGTIDIISASSPASSVGLLSIQAEATSPITSLTAHLMVGSADDLDVTDFALSSGISTDGTWTVQSPITPGQLPLGQYSIVVDATDSGGDSVTGVAAGTLSYVIEPAITLRASAPAVHYGQTETFTGQVIGTAPDGSQAAIAGLNVQIGSFSGAPGGWSATSDADGDFSVPLVAGETLTNPGSYLATAAATNTTGNGGSGTVSITAVPDPVQVSAKLSPPHVKFRGKEVLATQVQYRSGGSWHPLRGETVQIFSQYEYGTPVASGTTASNGGFSARLPTTATSTWDIEAGETLTTESQWFDPTTKLITETVQMPVYLTAFTVHVNPDRRVEALLCVSTPEGDDTSPADPSRLELQYARTARGSWHNLGKISGLYGGYKPCATGNRMEYEGAPKAPALSDYYRVVLAASALFQANQTKVLKAATRVTRIEGFDVNPRSVPYGGKVKISGYLQDDRKGWHGLGRQKVFVLYKYPGSYQVWNTLGYINTNSHGHFSVTLTDGASASLEVLYNGNDSYLQARSGSIYVSVAGSGNSVRFPRYPADRAPLLAGS